MANLNQLQALKDRELEFLYASSELPLQVPDGESNGRAIVLPGTFIGKVLSWFDNLVWKGKIFKRLGPTRADLVNKILGLHIVRADVFFGPSWSDSKRSVIIDYRHTSWIAWFIRDEIRRVEEGLYLGKAYIRLPFGKRCMFLYFALDFRS